MRVPSLRRALLYVPGSSQRMLEKSRGLQVDCIAYDLEDSVTLSKKAEARSLILKTLNQPIPAHVQERAVRINSVDSGLALADLTEVLKSPNLTTVVVPKVNSASDLTFVTDVITHSLLSDEGRPPVNLIALIESAKAIQSLSSITQASSLLTGLIFAAEDFALDLSLIRTPSLTEFLYARSMIATAARAADLPSTIDLVTTTYKGDKGQKILEEEARSGKQLGFNGKQVIHPSQVEVVQRVFSPEEDEVEWAIRVVIADEKADRSGRGAWTMDGKMIDAPVSGKARQLVEKATACGFDIEKLRQKWKDQEPE